MPKIKVKRGSNEAWKDETLEYGELGYNKDTKELMVGDEGEPTKYVDKNHIDYIHGKVSSDKQSPNEVYMEDISRTNQEAEIFVNWKSWDNLGSGYNLKLISKNIFNAENRSYLGISDSEKATLQGLGLNLNQIGFKYLLKKLSDPERESLQGKFWFGDMAASGYYIDRKYSVALPFFSQTNEFNYKAQSASWGIGMDFIVNPSEEYNISIEETSAASVLVVGVFNSADAYAFDTTSAETALATGVEKLTQITIYSKGNYTYTIPSGCNRMIVIAVQQAHGDPLRQVMIKGIQFYPEREGRSDTTGYYTKTINATREPQKISLCYPYTKIVATPKEKVNGLIVTYQKDTTKAYEELRNAIVSLTQGGNV